MSARQVATARRLHKEPRLSVVSSAGEVLFERVEIALGAFRFLRIVFGRFASRWLRVGWI